MHALILSSHPLVDHATHKAALLSALVERDVSVTVMYAGTRLRNYTAELRRRSLSDVRKIVSRQASKDTSSPAGGDLRSAARQLGSTVASFPTLAEPAALRTVAALEPDVVLNLSALFIPRAFLDAARHRVVGAHYAELPRVRGGDTVRWSVLLDVPLAVSFQLLTPELDMGDVVGRRAVDVTRGDDITALRRRCQSASVRGYLDVVEAVRTGALVPRAQQRSDGSTFFRMGTFLRKRVDEILACERYSHYAPSR